MLHVRLPTDSPRSHHKCSKTGVIVIICKFSSNICIGFLQLLSFCVNVHKVKVYCIFLCECYDYYYCGCGISVCVFRNIPLLYHNLKGEIWNNLNQPIEYLKYKDGPNFTFKFAILQQFCIDQCRHWHPKKYTKCNFILMGRIDFGSHYNIRN